VQDMCSPAARRRPFFVKYIKNRYCNGL